MKKIAVMPVKDEEWILEHNLTCASLFFDHIIVADQNSSDRTPEICKKFPKVVYIKNNSTEYNEGNRRQLLLDAARSFDGNNFIANLAADEIFSANILDPQVFDRLVKDQKPGTGFSFHWVQLWRSEKEYRDDTSVWSNSYRPFAFIDDRITNYRKGFAHLSIIPEDLMSTAVICHEIKVLHYQFVSFERMLAKQRWARLLEFGHYSQPDFLKSIILNNKYYITKDEHNLKTSPVSSNWLHKYAPFIIKIKSEPWHISASIEFIKKYSPQRLYWLDIWDYTWPHGIEDKRNMVQRFYHKHQFLILILNKLVPKFVKDLIKKI